MQATYEKSGWACELKTWIDVSGLLAVPLTSCTVLRIGCVRVFLPRELLVMHYLHEKSRHYYQNALQPGTNHGCVSMDGRRFHSLDRFLIDDCRSILEPVCNVWLQCF